MTQDGAGGPVAAIVVAVAEDLRSRVDELNRLDGVAGDGDLGLTVASGAAALLELGPSLADLDEAAAIRACGAELARRAPSTSGTLVAFGCIAASRATIPDGASALERAAAYLEAAAASIATRGKVERGGRTMLDALAPAAEAFREAADRGASAEEAVEAAARAAESGAVATAAMAPTVGRAAWLADRARGHEDAGARLVAMALHAAAAAVSGDRERGAPGD